MATINELFSAYHVNHNNLEFINFIQNPTNLKALNDKDDEHQTVLHHAAYYEEFNIVKMLLDRHADVSIKDKHNRSPLSYCLDNSSDINLSILRLMITAGADIDEADERGFTSLHYAVLAGNIIKIKKLLSLNSSINKKNKNAETPLQLAISRDIPNKNEILQLLFKHGVIISQDFSNTEIPLGLTDGIIMLGSTVWSDTIFQSIPVDRSIKGFEKAITNLQEFEEAVRAGVKFDYKALENASRENQNPEIKALHQKALANNKPMNTGNMEVKRSLAQGMATLMLHAKHNDRVKLEAKIQAMPEDIRILIDEEMNRITLNKSSDKSK